MTEAAPLVAPEAPAAWAKRHIGAGAPPPDAAPKPKAAKAAQAVKAAPAKATKPAAADKGAAKKQPRK